MLVPLRPSIPAATICRIVKRTRLEFNGAMGKVLGITLVVCLACLHQRTPAQEMASLSEMVMDSPNLP